MSLQHIAKHLENKGRGRDTELIHMSKNEIKGLQSLAKAHGGSLTKNPETGLYEAGFLEDILPMVAAGAAMYFTAGAATPLLMSAGMGATSAGILAGAGAGALISGGTAAIQGGDVGNAALMGGVVGGIGGGMNGFMSGAEGVSGAGGDFGISAGTAPVDPNIALSQSTQVGTNAISLNPATGSVVDPLAAAPVPTGGYSGFTGGQAVPGPNTPTSTLTPTANYINSAAPGTSITTPGISSSGTSLTTQSNPGGITDLSQMNAGDRILKQQADAVAAAQKDPNASWWSKQTPMEKAGYAIGGAGLTAAIAGNAGTNMAPEEDEYTSTLKRISPDFRAQEPIRPNPYYRAQYPTYAEGGPVERMSQMNTAMNPQGGLYPQGMIDKTQYAIPTQRPTSMEVVDAGAQRTFAVGGIADLGSYSDGGRLLKGPGDGVSDNIPATIGGSQPARLADGEFVVPARIVSELGNGSTDAGARKLYQMMDRVQKKRKQSVGKGKFAVNARADKELPV